MKKGYIRLLIFELLVCLILFLNSFVWNILSRHTINIFLFGLIIVFKIFFGFEKDRHRFLKDVLMDVFIFLMVFFILYYLFGIIVSFSKPGNYYTVDGIKNYIIPIAISVILREFLRYHVLCKADGNRLVTGISVIMFILLDISTIIYYSNFSSNYDIFLFIALTLLPSVSSNIAFSYITLKVGYKPVMLYELVMSLYYYLIPIVPNPGNYISSVILLFLPMILLYRIFTFFKKYRDEEVDREYKKYHYGWLVLSGVITVILVYFTSGYFKYWAIAVASGSMSPTINKGDVVVIEKVDDDYHKIKKGDVLAFRYENVAIVHRIVNIVKDGNHYYFYTKGDANSNEDNFAIEEDMVIGVVHVKLPFIGIPTVWLNEL